MASGVWYVKYRDPKGKEFASFPAYWLDGWPTTQVVISRTENKDVIAVSGNPQFLKSDFKTPTGKPFFDEPKKKSGFWTWLFGGGLEHD
jgi:hypothetical protein